MDFAFNDFSSGTNLLATPLSMNDNTKSLEWAESENVELSGLNGIQKMLGNETNITLPHPTDRVLALCELRRNNDKYLSFVYSDSTQAYFCIADGIEDDFTVVKSGLEKTATYHIIPYNKGVIVSNGKRNSFVYQKDEKPEIITCRTFEAYGIYPIATCVFKGRIYAFTDNAKHNGVLYCSAVGQPDKWSTADGGGYWAQISGSDSPMRGLHPYGEALALHRDNSTVLLTGSSIDPNGADPITFQPFTNKGSRSYRGIINYDNKQMFYDDGIYCLQYSSLQQIQLSNDLAKFIAPAFSEMLPANMENIIACSYPKNKQVWFFMSESDTATDELDVVWIMDRKNPKSLAWYKRKATPVLCACTFNDEIYTGTSDGRILKENTTNTLDGETFSGYWYSAWLKFNTLKLKSIGEGMDISFDDFATNDVKLKIRKNTIATSEKTKDVRLKSTNVTRKNIPGEFKSLQIGFTSDTDFKINSIAFYDINLEE